MSKNGKTLSKNGKINQSNRNLDFPGVMVIQYSLVLQTLSWTNPNRNAPYWRFYRTLTPGAKILFENREYILGVDHVILIPPNLAYASFSDQPFSQLYMHFTWDLDTVIRHPVVLPVKDDIRTVSDAENFFACDKSFFPVKMYALLLSYLAELAKQPLLEKRRIDPRILQAVHLMEKNFRSRNSEIAYAVHMSCDAFQRLFKREMGISSRKYLISRRMENAQSLLMNSSQTIHEIALDSGFSDRYQFTKAFTAFFKISPGSYRKRLGKP